MSIVPTATQHETLDPSSPHRFMRIYELPAELLENILDEVEFLDDDLSEIRKEKIQSIDRGSTRCDIYSNDQAPILNTFQNLAVVNRQFNRLCSPRLWEILRFPSALPTLMSQWDDIIFKNREFVRFIEIDLSAVWLYWIPDQVSGPDCDNLMVHRQNSSDSQRRGLSLVNATKVLSALPNLQSLHVVLPRSDESETDDDEDMDMDVDMDENTDIAELRHESSLVHLRLKNIITHLPGLRYLALVENSYKDIVTAAPAADSYVIDMIKCLPLLESLKCAQLYRSTSNNKSSDPTDLFEWHLAQLRNLSSLDLTQCDNLDGTWSKQIWPKKITSLRLFLCSKINYEELHELLPHFAPKLIKFDIGPIFPGIETIQADFGISTLTDLTLNISQLGTSNPLLSRFHDCKRIRSIGHYFVRPNEWKPIADMVCASTWPELKSLDLGTGGTRAAFDGRLDIIATLTRLQEFCTRTNVLFVYPKENE